MLDRMLNEGVLKMFRKSKRDRGEVIKKHFSEFSDYYKNWLMTTYNTPEIIELTREFEEFHKGDLLLRKMFYDARRFLSYNRFCSKQYRIYATVLYVMNRRIPEFLAVYNTPIGKFLTENGSASPLSQWNEHLQIMNDFLDRFTSERNHYFISNDFQHYSIAEQYMIANEVEELLAAKDGLYPLNRNNVN
jgi:hypothetical protein